MSERKDEEGKRFSGFCDSMLFSDIMQKMRKPQGEASCCPCSEIMHQMVSMCCQPQGEGGDEGKAPDQGNPKGD